MDERLEFGTSTSSVISSELKLRTANAYRINMTNTEFKRWGKKSGSTTNRRRSESCKIISDDGDTVELEYKKPYWARFEDEVWELFYSLGRDGKMLLPKGDIICKYDDPLTKQIDGLFSDSKYVYVVECKYRTTPGGAQVDPGNIRDDLTQWTSDWGPICKRLGKMEEFHGKKPVFILATRGVKITDKLRKIGDRIGTIFLPESKITGLLSLSKNMEGSSMRSIFCQEIFRESSHEEIPGLAKSFYATRIQIDGKILYHFFAKSGDLVELAYVPRRVPTGGDISNAYQRIIKPAKVTQIGRHLSEKGSFFPNSIVLATEEDLVWSKQGGDLGVDANSEYGKLTVPKKYGCLFVIDGQHRLFGTEGASSEVRKNKPLSICLIEGLETNKQAQMFTSINQTQSKVDPNLLWDLYGELGTISPPPNMDSRQEVEMALKFIISNVWKRVNTSQNHPMQGVINIPSHQKPSGTKISFGNTLCKYLFQRRGIWNPGFLRPLTGRWDGSENFAFRRVAYFYKSLLENLSDEWASNEKNWLRSNYSLIVITIVFTHMVEMFGGTRFKDKWNTDGYKELIDTFAKIMANAIQSSDSGFYDIQEKRDILKAGSASARGDFANDLVIYIRNSGTEGYKELAPKITEDDDGDVPSAKTKKRVKVIEEEFREIVFNALYEKHNTKWFSKLPSDVKGEIEFRKQEAEILGREFEEPPTIEYLEQTSTNHLFKIMSSSGATKVLFFKKNKERGILNVTESRFKQEWLEYAALRNIIAHHGIYPSTESKEMMLARLGMMETHIRNARNYLEEE